MNCDVLVIGGGISGLAAAYEAKKQGRSVLVMEASDTCGGVLRTHRPHGYLMEEGAESMLASKPAARQLCEELGIADQLIGTQPQHRGTLVVHHQKLRSVPEGFRLLAPQEVWPFLKSPIFSWWGKVRMGLEWFVPARRAMDDESLAQFVRRRFGQECLERMAQPMAAGIYTADPEELSMHAAMPQFVELERRHGSILRGFFYDKLREKASGPRYALFQTLRDGMGRLPEALVASLGAETVLRQSPVSALTPLPEGGWEVTAGATFQARQVVMCLPAYRAARLCRPFAAELAEQLGGIRYFSSATVNLVYPLSAMQDPTRAYGFVVPSIEDLDILACTYSHRKYAGRCPADGALLRTYIGGAHNESLVDLDDTSLVERSHRVLSRLLGIQGEPTLSHVARVIKAMPLYQVGHLPRTARIEQAAAQIRDFALTGNYLHGVGIPDCIGLAREVVSKLLQR